MTIEFTIDQEVDILFTEDRYPQFRYDERLSFVWLDDLDVEVFDR